MMTKTMASLAVLVVITACATRREFSERERFFTGEETIRVHVQNDNFMDARLHALGSGGRYLLGVVTGRQQAILEIPWDFSGSLNIEIDLLAGSKCTTRTIDVNPGDMFDLRIESTLSKTAVCW